MSGHSTERPLIPLVADEGVGYCDPESDACVLPASGGTTPSDPR